MSKDDEKNGNDKKDYEVGYGKPPKYTQFGQPGGNKGNTKGRPPGRNVLEFDRLTEDALWYCIHESAQKPVAIKEDGQELMVPLVMAIMKGMARDAANGDPEARKQYLRLLEKATKGRDKVYVEMQDILANFRERKMLALQTPGSLECFDVYYNWFMVKKHFRAMDGVQHWPYEDEEPITQEDWNMYLDQHSYLQRNPDKTVQWPPDYPSRSEQ